MELQKSDADPEPRARSPLTEKFSYDLLPKSPLTYNTSNLFSPQGLPPLKFHSGLLLTPRLDKSDDYEKDEDNESVASVWDYANFNYTEEEYEEEEEEEEEEEMLDKMSSRNNLNRGMMNNLKIEVPGSNRRYAYADSGTNRVTQNASTMSTGNSILSQLRERVQLRNSQVRIQ